LGDSVIATLYVRFAKSDCLKVIDLEDKRLKRGEVIKRVILNIDRPKR